MRFEVTCECGQVNDLCFESMDLYDEYDCEKCNKVILIVDDQLLIERESFRVSNKNEKYL